MPIIKKSKTGSKDYNQYIAKSGILIFAVVFGFGFLVIAGTAIYLYLTLN